jgi:DNA-binding CsgD family transcriptional regulator
MRKLKLLQRLVAALARNEGVQSKRTEILQRLESLSPREVDVLCYVLGGQLNREIAAELGVSEKTIKVHRGRVMKKLGVRSTAQLFPMVWRVLWESGFNRFYKPRRQVRRSNPGDPVRYWEESLMFAERRPTRACWWWLQTKGRAQQRDRCPAASPRVEL